MSEFDQFVTALTYLIYIVPILLIILILYGGILTVGMILTTALAYPTYVALYTLEMVIPVLKLNRPETTTKRFMMNIAASFCFLFTSLIGLRIYEGLRWSDSGSFRENLIAVESVLLPACFTVTACLLVVYLISYFSEPDKRDPLEKLERLVIPDLIRKFIGV